MHRQISECKAFDYISSSKQGFMAISNANLIVTNATWGNDANSLADALTKDGKRY